MYEVRGEAVDECQVTITKLKRISQDRRGIKELGTKFRETPFHVCFPLYSKDNNDVYFYKGNVRIC